MMNVGELKRMLEGIPEDMVVICTSYSDYAEAEADIVEAVAAGFYIMRAHETMSADKKARSKKYLLISV